MQKEQQKIVLGALQLVLRPIVKILLKYGIGYSEFAETVKTAFVDVGTSDFGIRGRPTNISRVAVMTGLTRKEVRRLRTKLESGEEVVAVKTTPLTAIMQRWHAEKEYLDDLGRPARLPYTGDSRSFTSLVKRFGGDVPPGAMRTELKRVGAIEIDSNGFLVVKKRSLVSSGMTEQVRTALVHSVYPLLSNIFNNTCLDGTDVVFPRYTAHSTYIKKADVPRLRRMCSDRLSDLAESFDDLFIAYQSDGSSTVSSDQNNPIVVGMYYFEESDPNAEYDW